MERNIDRWDGVADWYDDVTADGVDDPATAALLSLVPDIDGCEVADVACGQGRVARALALRGASVVAIDVAPRLLDKARARELSEPLGIRYRLADIADCSELRGRNFTGITCNYGLSDIDDLGAALRNVSRILRPGGWFVFSILHPCFPGWGFRPSSWAPGSGYGVEGYWKAESEGFRGVVGANHRMLSTYLNLLACCDLLVEEVLEPGMPSDWRAEVPGADTVPVFLAIRCRKVRG